ncbi:GNAT family N-acetyltransferase [Streptomyces sp. JJ36]|uniref:GNAT family N-acetyltransferase n=1 Tax=Streptomyces sp. JJ36 TaxID=2736645 RepID=UPI001F341A36|nr:GNAT family N-acetyltransferase [Streptomyces sp. JJ36]MCF6526109.1 GNAT family N-acetyltransferase [Streptomyces sp. JJ36]
MTEQLDVRPAPRRTAVAGPRNGGSGPGRLTVTLCRDPAAFDALAADWNALYARCPAATPFQHHAWLHSWWLSYGTPGRLRLVLVREGDALVGAAPLMLVHRPYPVLVPLGGDISDFCDVLVDSTQQDRVLRALTEGLLRAARGALVDLREVRPGGMAELLHERWPGARLRNPDSVCLELPCAPLEDLLERMPKPSARRTRGKLRKLDALGIEHRSVPPEEVPAAVDTLLRLHGLQWQGRGVTPEHLRPRFRDHLVRAAAEMARTGNALLTEYLLDGEVLAADVTLMSAGLSGGYLYGAHPELRAKADITTMLLRHDARYAADTGRGVLSMLRGTEPYKRHWRPVEVVNQRLLLARTELAPVLRAYAAQRAVRTRLAGTVRDRAPGLPAVHARLRERCRRFAPGRG